MKIVPYSKLPTTSVIPSGGMSRTRPSAIKPRYMSRAACEVHQPMFDKRGPLAVLEQCTLLNQKLDEGGMFGEKRQEFSHAALDALQRIFDVFRFA